MSNEPPWDADESPVLLDGRILIEIEAWNWYLHLGPCSDATPPDHRFQGGLSYGRSFELRGRVLAPRKLRSRVIWVWIYPFGPELKFGPEDDIGQINFRSPTAKPGELRAALQVPESAIPTMATCLASVWKYLHIRTFDPDEEQVSISNFSFSSDIHESLRAWVNAK